MLRLAARRRPSSVARQVEGEPSFQALIGKRIVEEWYNCRWQLNEAIRDQHALRLVFCVGVIAVGVVLFCRDSGFGLVEHQRHLIEGKSLAARAEVLMACKLDLFEQLVDELPLLFELLLLLMHERLKLVEIIRQVVLCLVHEMHFTTPHVTTPYDAAKKHGLASALDRNRRATN